MADIPSTSAKVNDLEVSSDAPVTEALMLKMAGNANAFADSGRYLKEAYFTANGTFLLPLNAQPSVIIEGCGGGGGGAGTTATTSGSAGSAGTPGQFYSRLATLTPGQSYSVTVGGGGAGGTWGGGGASGGVGGDSAFGSIATWTGGRPGVPRATSYGLPATLGYRDGRGGSGNGGFTASSFGGAGIAGYVLVYYWTSTP